MSNNKLWVTWKDSEGNQLFDTVDGLEDTGIVADLRKVFVQQQNLLITPAAVKVHEPVKSEELDAEAVLEKYFTNSNVKKPGPGMCKGLALVVTLPPERKVVVRAYSMHFVRIRGYDIREYDITPSQQLTFILFYSCSLLDSSVRN